MKKTDFTSQAPGKAIKTLNGYLAFIPDSLPPKITWSDKLLATLSNADRSLAKLAGAGNNFPVPHVVTRTFIRKEAVLSSQIERTRTSFKGLLAYEARLPKSEDEVKDALEVHNYVRALDHGFDRLNVLPLSIRLIKEIHATLMKGVRGELMTPGEVRRSQNWIGRPGAKLEEARYVPPPVDEMHDCLSDLERFIHSESELPKLLRIGMIHYQFEAIHPFLDGNGRIGRLLVTSLLVSWNLIPQPLLYLSDFIEANRQEYYDRLLAVSQKGAWETWLMFFLDGVNAQAHDACQRIMKLQELRLMYQNKFQRDRSRNKLQKLVDYLISTPVCSISQAHESLKIGSFTTIQRLMDKLEAFGIVQEVTGNRRNRIYQADQILMILEKRIQFPIE